MGTRRRGASFAFGFGGQVAAALNVTYGWDNEGRPIWQEYPDLAAGSPNQIGARYAWGFDGMGRLATMTETDANGVVLGTLVSGVNYNAAGQMTEMFTPGETETRAYNALGQLTRQSGYFGKNVEYRYSATQNDGRITQRVDAISGEEVNYLYDSLGRLSSAVTTTNAAPQWGLSFAYDGFGNKLQQAVTKGTGPSHTYTVDPVTNRLSQFGHQSDETDAAKQLIFQSTAIADQLKRDFFYGAAPYYGSTIYLNTDALYGVDAKEMAITLIHESLHLVGFVHSDMAQASVTDSAIGEKCIK
jgi:uncharacterized protein RhaS with RHS repeats